MRGEDVGGAGPEVGGRPGEQLEEEHAQRVHVAAPVLALTGGLFRRHVVRRAEDEPGGGLACVARPLGEPGDAEVGQLRAPVAGEQHVLRLDVAVVDAAVMRGAERPGELAHQRHRLSGHQRTESRQTAARVSPSTSSIASRSARRACGRSR
jgi:hypothetical protein